MVPLYFIFRYQGHPSDFLHSLYLRSTCINHNQGTELLPFTNMKKAPFLFYPSSESQNMADDCFGGKGEMGRGRENERERKRLRAHSNECYRTTKYVAMWLVFYIFNKINSYCGFMSGLIFFSSMMSSMVFSIASGWTLTEVCNSWKTFFSQSPCHEHQWLKQGLLRQGFQVFG